MGIFVIYYYYTGKVKQSRVTNKTTDIMCPLSKPFCGLIELFTTIADDTFNYEFTKKAKYRWQQAYKNKQNPTDLYTYGCSTRCSLKGYEPTYEVCEHRVRYQTAI